MKNGVQDISDWSQKLCPVFLYTKNVFLNL